MYLKADRAEGISRRADEFVVYTRIYKRSDAYIHMVCSIQQYTYNDYALQCETLVGASIKFLTAKSLSAQKSEYSLASLVVEKLFD